MISKSISGCASLNAAVNRSLMSGTMTEYMTTFFSALAWSTTPFHAASLAGAAEPAAVVAALEPAVPSLTDEDTVAAVGFVAAAAVLAVDCDVVVALSSLPHAAT